MIKIRSTLEDIRYVNVKKYTYNNNNNPINYINIILNKSNTPTISTFLPTKDHRPTFERLFFKTNVIFFSIFQQV